ncbi:MAG: hypothetical protein ACJA0U_001272 [Salibacteraceae bacterium]|jgi:hypothetical protein
MKNLITLLSCAVMLFAANSTKAQILFSESFDAPAGFTAQGWTLIDADGSTNNAGITSIFGATSSWIVNADVFDGTDSVAMSTSYLSPAGTTNDWMITPMVAGLNGTGELSWEALATDPAFPDGYEVWVTTSIVGGTPVVTDFTGSGTMVFSIAAAPAGAGNWAAETVSLTPYAGLNVWVAFRNNSTDKFILQLDNVLVENPILVDDLAADSTMGEYTSIPLLHASAMPLEAFCSNSGTLDITDAVVTANVYLNGGLVQTTTSPATGVLVGASALLNAGTYTPAAVGSYEYEYVVSTALGSDIDATNDTVSYSFVVDQNFYARDDGNVTIALGVGIGNSASIGNNYEVTNAGTIMDSVFFFRNGVLGDTTKVEVYSLTAGVPTTLVGTSVEHIFTVADSASTGAAYVLEVLDLLNNPLVLAPGSYCVTVVEYESNDNMQLRMTDALFTPNTIFAEVGGGAFGPLESFGWSKTPLIRPRFIPNCNTFAYMSNSTDAGCGLSDGTATTVPSLGAGSYTYQWGANAANQTTATATGLAAGTYYVDVTDAFGCTGVDTIIVANPNAPTGTTTFVEDVCADMNGSATALPTGGTGTYIYSWDAAAANQTTPTATGLGAGTYNVTVTDAANCEVVLMVIVTAPAPLTATIVDNLDGSLTVTAIGGTSPYSYLWDDAANQTTATASGLNENQFYTVTVTDSNSCVIMDTLTSAMLGLEDLSSIIDVKAFPNPANDNLTVVYSFSTSENATVRLLNNLGQVVESSTLKYAVSGQLILNTAEIAAGMYRLEVLTSQGRVAKQIVITH